MAIFWYKVCAKIANTRAFLSTQKSKKVDQKMGYQPQKVQEKKNSKNGVKTAQRPLFKELWAILVKLGKKMIHDIYGKTTQLG